MDARIVKSGALMGLVLALCLGAAEAQTQGATEVVDSSATATPTDPAAKPAPKAKERSGTGASNGVKKETTEKKAKKEKREQREQREQNLKSILASSDNLSKKSIKVARDREKARRETEKAGKTGGAAGSKEGG